MLHVKRASAGSGKTYQLAKMYIKLLLSQKEGNNRKLRPEASLKEALSSIMAVTFTVKATAEMKHRIVKNLAALANADNLPDEEAAKVDYLKDFMLELDTDKSGIAELARKALRHLLLHFSDFRVQTIDSFFQSVLHTFAYEASLDDNFNMEIDSGYINSIGFDSALDSISRAAARNPRDSELAYWLNRMMKQESGKNRWNVFARNDSEKHLYGRLIKDTENLEKEEFHKYKEALETYFNNLDRPFSEVVGEVDREVNRVLREKYEERKKAAADLKKELDAIGLDAAFLYHPTHNRVLESLEEFNPDYKAFEFLASKKPVKMPKEGAGRSLSSNGKTAFAAICRDNPKVNPSRVNDIDSAFLCWREKHNEYLELLNMEMPRIATWEHYKTMFPRLVIAMEIADRKREFLDSTNTLQISDTTHLLARIIDKDDTPFVYERMGSRLNHYLIDEFQDTSRMQWENLYPLLSNSEASDFDNLIIGDAKQSIYRFRNADYRLIQEVSGMFPKVVPYTSDTEPEDLKKENTNFRSKPRIVEMNNFIFSQILDVSVPGGGKGETPLFNDEIKEIYTDCVQALPERNEKENEPAPSEGYAEFVFHPAVSIDRNDEPDNDGYLSLENPGFAELTGRILELTSRGYDFRDIGILVRSHEHGNAVVKAISKHNAANPEAQIRVISEENLLVASALSVRLIIHALEIASRGLGKPLPDNPVLRDPISEQQLFDLLKTLPSLALPAVTEAIAEKFVPRKRRDAEAPFLAALQDAVLDYCASRAGDIGQFLKWWKRKSKVLTINSPEESDGVKIQTIHKAKGLEHKCLIIPYADFNFRPAGSHSEWRWVQPADCIPCRDLLPPVLPVATVDKLGLTAHGDVRERYCREVALDELNKMYVAFTRAAKELYVYLPLQVKDTESKAAYILKEMLLEEAEGATSSPLLSSKLEVEELEAGRVEVRYGTPALTQQILAEKKSTVGNSLILSKYEVSSEGAVMQFEDGNKLLNASPRVAADGEVADARTEGKLKHRIMQMVEKPEDLPKALREMKREGFISPRQLEDWGSELRGAIEQAAEYGWFDPGNRIITERPILEKDKINYRPDRIVIDSEGNASVIDYKFGARETAHRRQVKNYAGLLAASNNFKSVSAFLWYVSEGVVVKVV